MLSDQGPLSQLVLNCFEGDIVILYHLCRKRDLEIRAFKLLAICNQILQSNQLFAQRASALAVLAYILELKILDLLELRGEKSLAVDSLVEENTDLILRTNLAESVGKMINALVLCLEKSSIVVKAMALSNAPRLKNTLFELLKTRLERFRKKNKFLSGFCLKLLNRLKNLGEFKQTLARLMLKQKQIAIKKVAKTRAECLGFFLAALDLYKECDLKFERGGNDVLIYCAQASRKGLKSWSQ